MQKQLRSSINARWLLAMPVLALGVMTASCNEPTGSDAARPASHPSGHDGLVSADARAGISTAGIIGSKHDFTSVGGAGVDLCTPCHTPHLAVSRPPALDSRPVSEQRVRPYTAAGIELDASSLLCLSCHDGVVAPDVYRSAHGTRAASPGGAWIGPASLTSHPIGVKYPVADPRYRSDQAVLAGGRIKLPDGRIQCISCHDPHNTRRIDAMLVQSNEGSRLCLACHRL